LPDNVPEAETATTTSAGDDQRHITGADHEAAATTGATGISARTADSDL
jgi:hypothetical protein